jgi:peptidoglycan/xylan/chitin deacetylase (PgdA/CDA1 family)
LHRYFIKTPWLVKQIFPGYIWSIPASENEVYLTFDDGPHPEITPWVMNQLKAYGAEATFFCIGENVERYHEVYRKLLMEGHAVGNHTQHHINGWESTTMQYLDDVREASKFIQSNLFRPPYGRIKKRQAGQVAEAMQQPGTRIIMWDVLSGDFDTSYSKEQCLSNVLNNVEKGSVIVFHDSEKAFRNLEFILPKVLDSLHREGYKLKKIVF